jgi:hypothetical protein
MELHVKSHATVMSLPTTLRKDVQTISQSLGAFVVRDTCVPLLALVFCRIVALDHLSRSKLRLKF